ncbi:hypothetical protein ACQEVB_38880 [Pseudonocardia sp. CA-107938]|uniref:hypothetical protein n=1 Tax=Pseudonocardia sp. CA-107938 TaxID=3240021 RepID=UPI003D93852A
MTSMARSVTATWWIWTAGWLGMLLLALVNGTLRAVVVQPVLGESLARAIATVVLLAALAAYVWWMQGRWPIPTARQAWLTGMAWVVLTLTFEFGWGRLVERLSWSTMLADYDVAAGRIWVLVPLGIAVAPALSRFAAARRRSTTTR